MPKTVYLFRHGDVEDQYRDRIRGGSTDCLLSPTGEHMSVANAQFIVQANVQKVFTSGMRRTDFVGEHVFNQHGIPYEAHTGLKEMHMGEWEGKTIAEANERHPAEADAFRKNPLSGAFPGLEDPALYQQRVLAAWEAILTDPSERIAVIAHGVTNTVILREILGSDSYPLTQIIGCMNEISIGPPHELTQENITVYPAHLLDSIHQASRS